MKSYQDLINRKQALKVEISALEAEITNNKIVKLSSAFIGEESLKEPLMESISSLNIKDLLTGPFAKIFGTFLMSNKLTRKYAISFTILKEMVPFISDKIKTLLDQNGSEDQIKNKG